MTSAVDRTYTKEKITEQYKKEKNKQTRNQINIIMNIVSK